MFGRGEKVERRERLSRGRARKVGENVKDAVNVGMGESAEELGRYFASGDDFGADPEMAADIAAAERVLSWLPEDERTSAEVIGKLKEKAAQKKWDNYIGAALAAKEKEVGSMLTDEEREAEKRATKEKLLSAEKRAEMERKVAKKTWGNKGYLRVKRKFVGAMLGTLAGVTMFLSACGTTTEKEVREVTEFTLGNEDDDNDDSGEDITSEMIGETSTVEAERPAGVRPGANDEAIGDETMRSLDEILGLSKSCNLAEFTPEELELAGNDPELLAWFESSEESRVLENGLQLNYSEGYYSENKTAGKNSFAESLQYAYGDREAAMDGLMEAYFAQPQELAAAVAQCPSILRAAGIDEDVIAMDNLLEQSRAIYQQMLTREDGGALQARLRGALKLVLMNEQTEYNFYIENGIEDTFYLKPIDPSTTESPETNLELELEYGCRRHGAEQLQVTFGDESIDINLKCRQRNDNKDTPVKKVTQETTTTTQEETTPEETEETTTVVDEEEPDESEEDAGEDEDDEDEGDEDEGDDEEGGDEGEDPEDPEGEEEEIKQKNPEGQKEVVDGGIHTNPVTPTENINNMVNDGIQQATNVAEENQIPQEEITGDKTGTYAVTENPTIGGVNGDGKTGAAEADGVGAEGSGENSGESGTADYNAVVTEGAVDDENLSEEERQAAVEAEQKAEAEENLGDMTPEQFAEFLKGYVDELYEWVTGLKI